MTGLTVLLALAHPVQQQPDSVPADSAVRLEAVVITATRARGTRRETAVATASREPDAAARGTGRVAADLLRDMAGVQIQQTSAGQGSAILRGLLGNQVLYLVNGIPMNNGTYRDGPGQYLATIDPETIRRMEVVRGPASVLYGSDAQGGVVNLITRPHPASRGWTIAGTAFGSTANTGGRGRLSVGFDRPDLSFGVGASLLEAGDLHPGGGRPTQAPTGFSATGLDARLAWRAADTHELIAGVEHFGMRHVPRYDRYVTFRAPAEGRDFRHLFDPQIRQLGFARHRWTPGSQWVTGLETTASLSMQREGRLQQSQDATGVAAPEVEETRDDVSTPGLSVVGNSLVMVGARPIRLTWGAEAYRDMIASSGTITNLAAGTQEPLVRQTAGGAAIASGRFPDGASMDRVGVFLEADTRVIERLAVSVGGRWNGTRADANVGAEFGGAVENRTSAFTGQVGAVFAVAGGLDLAVRVAEGFRAPNLYDLTNVGTVPGGIVLPNVDARPERSLSLEASVRYGDDATAIEVTSYRVEIRDFIDRAPGTFNGDTLFQGELVFLGRNVGEAVLRGVEAEAVRRQGPFEARATLLVTVGDQQVDGAEEPMAKIPPTSGTGRLSWRGSEGRVRVSWTLDWATRQDRLGSRDLVDPRIRPGGTRGYVVHGVEASAAFSESFSLAGGIGNLGDVLYRTHASGVDSPGRHVWLGVSLLEAL